MDCGAEDAIENAMGTDLCSFYPGKDGNPVEEWKSSEIEAYIVKLNNVCLAKLSDKERLAAKQELEALRVTAGI